MHTNYVSSAKPNLFFGMARTRKEKAVKKTSIAPDSDALKPSLSPKANAMAEDFFSFAFQQIESGTHQGDIPPKRMASVPPSPVNVHHRTESNEQLKIELIQRLCGTSEEEAKAGLRSAQNIVEGVRSKNAEVRAAAEQQLAELCKEEGISSRQLKRLILKTK